MVKTAAEGKDFQERILMAADVIGAADALLIAAGVGMGVDSGLPDSRDNKRFWYAYPPEIQKMNSSFEEKANPKWFKQHPRMAWGFYGHRLNLYRRITPHTGFAQLLEMGKGKSHGSFVLTSNIDGHFQTAGFDADRIEECHGSVHHLQCTQPCGDHIWSAEDSHISINSESLQAIGVLPSCRQCGVLARPNIFMFRDKSWIKNRVKEQKEHLWQWLENLLVSARHLVIIEIGVGVSVPTIRHRSEFYAKSHRATLIRINPRDHHVNKVRHLSIPLTGRVAIEAIWQAWNERSNR